MLILKDSAVGGMPAKRLAQELVVRDEGRFDILAGICADCRRRSRGADLSARVRRVHGSH